MTPDKIAFINLIANLGFDAATVIWKTISSSTTIDDAIDALSKSRGKTWNDYKTAAGTQ